mmetsp:Transcript_38127/g.110060  ORF Transcript_38127/g.110060 Transcript_38127/m.110060 type:complete len:376 (-) Transcript_38127:78-1205(-)
MAARKPSRLTPPSARSLRPPSPKPKEACCWACFCCAWSCAAKPKTFASSSSTFSLSSPTAASPSGARSPPPPSAPCSAGLCRSTTLSASASTICKILSSRSSCEVKRWAHCCSSSATGLTRSPKASRWPSPSFSPPSTWSWDRCCWCTMMAVCNARRALMATARWLRSKADIRSSRGPEAEVWVPPAPRTSRASAASRACCAAASCACAAASWARRAASEACAAGGPSRVMAATSDCSSMSHCVCSSSRASHRFSSCWMTPLSPILSMQVSQASSCSSAFCTATAVSRARWAPQAKAFWLCLRERDWVYCSSCSPCTKPPNSTSLLSSATCRASIVPTSWDSVPSCALRWRTSMDRSSWSSTTASPPLEPPSTSP